MVLKKLSATALSHDMKIGKSRFIILNTQQDVGGDGHINVMNNLYEVNRQCTWELGQIFGKMTSYKAHIQTISTY